MFSMILATANVTVPAHHAARLVLATSNTRPLNSRARCAAMVRRIYRASRAPRDSSISRRSPSSSTARFSTSSLVRCANAEMSVIAIGLLSRPRYLYPTVP
ncbi:Uncharacterised protein [Mycobacteroides abscessus subsp. abscessus]|nr:Uncharacterised protein [Mycobacteroides abscessus subsp. abscessus]